MRRLRAITFATALEILSEPLTLLVLIAALSLTVFAPVFHYHQFGDATRMARDAGLSASFLCGGAVAIFTTIRVFRREIESGTLEMVLVQAVSPAMFFLAKSLGAFLAYLLFVTCVFSVTSTIVLGAEVGGALAEQTGVIVSVWGPAVAAGVAVILLPLLIGALAHRFGRCRFVLTTMLTAVGLSLSQLMLFALKDSGAWLVRLLPAQVLIVAAASVILVATAAGASRFPANAAATAAGLVVLITLPWVGNYYVSDQLANGGSVSWGFVALAVGAAIPALFAFLIMGITWLKRR